MMRYGYINEDDAQEFVNRVNLGSQLIKEFNELIKDPLNDNPTRRRQIEENLISINNWFDKR